MDFYRFIADVIGEFNPLKLDSLIAMNFRNEGQGDWPIFSSLEFRYGETWHIIIKISEVRKSRIPVIGGGIIDLGEPSFRKAVVGEYKGLVEFYDELKGYHIVGSTIEVLGIRRIAGSEHHT